MIKRRSYTGTFKAQVVSEYIKGSRTLNELADEYGLHPNQIKNWKSFLLKRAADVFGDKRKNRVSHS